MKIKQNEIYVGGKIHKFKDIDSAAHWIANDWAKGRDLLEDSFISKEDFCSDYHVKDGKRVITASLYDLAEQYYENFVSEERREARADEIYGSYSDQHRLTARDLL